MENLTKYCTIARQIITDLAARKGKSRYFDIRYFAIIDDHSHHYILLRDGWRDTTRYYANIVHIEVAPTGKVWLHEDRTDLIIADMLLEAGIPQSEIVLAFHPPIVRPDTEFAVG